MVKLNLNGVFTANEGEKGPHHHADGHAALGLSALDEDRQASMADEGGASGAVMESQDPSEHHAVIPPGLRRPLRQAPKTSWPKPWVSLSVVAVVTGALVLAWRETRASQ